MSRSTQSTSTENEETENVEEFVWPEFIPSPAHRSFIERLRLARLERGLSIADMSDEVGLTFRLASEFETLAAPLPFDYLELWCETVGVPFADYLTIYWADEREWDARQAEKKALCITSTESGETEALEPSNENVNRGFGWLSFLRAALAHIARFFLSRFSTSG